MGYSKSKTIQRNEISGQHEFVQAPLGPGKSYGRNEIVKRENARQAALEEAISAESSGMVKGNQLDHPAWAEAKARLAADRDREDLETQAGRSDKNELTPRGKK